MVKQLSDRITSHELNPDVTGILLKGSGKKAFCAGGDVVSTFFTVIIDVGLTTS